MKQLKHIIFREFITRIRKKSFILITLLLPIFVAGLLLATIFIATNAQENLTIAVIDETLLFEDKFRGLDQNQLQFTYLANTLKVDDIKKEFQEEYDGLLYIPIFDLNQPRGITYYSDKQLGYNTEHIITQALTDEIKRRVLIREQYDIELINQLSESISIEKVIKDEAQYGRTSLAGGIGYIAGFVIYMFLLLYGAMVMKSVSEEKSNRVVEVMITIVKPFDLMLGKIIGLGLLGIFQFVIWCVLIFGVQTIIGILFADDLMAMQQLQTTVATQQSSASAQLITESLTALKDVNFVRILFSFLFYFIFGYIFYAAQFAAIGAAVTDDTDTQSYTFPITIPIIISIVLLSVAIEQPFSSAAWWGSMIPFSSPIIMMARIPYNVSWIEQIASMLILILSSFIMIVLAARVYSIGILIQGKKIKFSEIGKWIWMKR